MGYVYGMVWMTFLYGVIVYRCVSGNVECSNHCNSKLHALNKKNNKPAMLRFQMNL